MYYEVVLPFGKGGVCMDDFTRKFNIATEKDAEIHQILSTVYRALEEKGYNPINQIVGYILSEDPPTSPITTMPGP